MFLFGYYIYFNKDIVCNIVTISAKFINVCLNQCLQVVTIDSTYSYCFLFFYQVFLFYKTNIISALLTDSEN